MKILCSGSARFLDRFCTSENSLCNVFHDQARRHMSQLLVKFGVEVSSWHILRNTKMINKTANIIDKKL